LTSNLSKDKIWKKASSVEKSRQTSGLKSKKQSTKPLAPYEAQSQRFKRSSETGSQKSFGGGNPVERSSIKKLMTSTSKKMLEKIYQVPE